MLLVCKAMFCLSIASIYLFSITSITFRQGADFADGCLNICWPHVLCRVNPESNHTNVHTILTRNCTYQAFVKRCTSFIKCNF
jgi:hypothetical protein